jgi:hypothetical protein
MDKKLFSKAIIKYLSGLVLISALLFVPAGTLEFWNAWLFIAVLFIPMFLMGMVLAIKNPELLRKRLNAKEKDGAKRRGDLERAHVYRRLCYCGAGLSFWMARSAKGCCFCGSGCLFVLISALCGGFA